MSAASIAFARKIRGHALRMVHRTNSSHIGSGLSMADLIGVLYTSVLNLRPAEPKWPDRDRFILSKGHAAAMLYSALAQRGFFPIDWLDHYCEAGNPLAGHVTHCKVPGVEASSGSLGHGMGLGCGMALASKADKVPWNVYVLLSDGECDEGAIWEGALFAPHHKLVNLTVIVDYNKIQSFGSVKDVLDLEPFAEKWRAFGWNVIEIDGHDHVQIENALGERGSTSGQPRLVLAHTIKGKGVSFMEGQLAWHYKSPSAEQLEQALKELETP
jgi:transketolase